MNFDFKYDGRSTIKHQAKARQLLCPTCIDGFQRDLDAINKLHDAGLIRAEEYEAIIGRFEDRLVQAFMIVNPEE